MATRTTWNPNTGTVAADFTGTSASSGSSFAYTSGKIVATVASHAASVAYGHRLLGYTLDSGLFALKNWGPNVTWSGVSPAPASDNGLEVMKLMSSGFVAGATVFLRSDGKLYLRANGSGSFSSTGINTSPSTSVFTDGTTKHLELVFDRLAGSLSLLINGSDEGVLTLSGLTGGNGNPIERIAIGNAADLGTTAWVGPIQLRCDEATMNDDKTARPYSGGGGAGLQAPTSLLLAALHDLGCDIAVNTVTGLSVQIKAGANQTPPTGLAASGWTTPALSGGANPRVGAVSGGPVTVTLPSNAVHTLAAANYDGTNVSSYVTINVHGDKPPLYVADVYNGDGSGYVVLQSQSDLAGWQPVLEFHNPADPSNPAWTRGSANVATFAAHVSQVGWTRFSSTADYTQLANGTALDGTGMPVNSSGMRIRLDYTGIGGTPFFQAYTENS